MHTRRHFHYIDLLCLVLRGRNIFQVSRFFSNGLANQSQPSQPKLRRHGTTRSHSGPARAARGTYCDPSHHAQRPARLTRPGPSHSQQPAVHHSPQPASLAAARVTRSGPPSPAAACRHLPRAVTVVTRSGPPSLATARLNRRGPGTRRGQSHSDGAAARLCSLQPASLPQ